MAPRSDSPSRRESAGRHRANGSLEREIIGCLAAAGEPMTPAQVQAALTDDLAYTTVNTVLSRLYAKQAVTRLAQGRTFTYQLVGDSAGAQASVTAHRMRMLLDSGADRAGVLSRFIDTLDDDTERLLRRLLEDAEPESADQDRRRGRQAKR